MSSKEMQVADWLLKRPNVVMARPVEVTIKDKVYYGALYAEEYIRIKTERACTEGHASPGDKYVTYSIMLLGPRPRHKSNGVVYVWKDDLPLDDHVRSVGEWFVAAFFDGSSDDMHPFGRCFWLCMWEEPTYGPYKGWAIDTGCRVKYRRIPMSVKFLDE